MSALACFVLMLLILQVGDWLFATPNEEDDPAVLLTKNPVVQQDHFRGVFQIELFEEKDSANEKKRQLNFLEGILMRTSEQLKIEDEISAHKLDPPKLRMVSSASPTTQGPADERTSRQKAVSTLQGDLHLEVQYYRKPSGGDVMARYRFGLTGRSHAHERARPRNHALLLDGPVRNAKVEVVPGEGRLRLAGVGEREKMGCGSDKKAVGGDGTSVVTSPAPIAADKKSPFSFPYKPCFVGRVNPTSFQLFNKTKEGPTFSGFLHNILWPDINKEEPTSPSPKDETTPSNAFLSKLSGLVPKKCRLGLHVFNGTGNFQLEKTDGDGGQGLKKTEAGQDLYSAILETGPECLGKIKMIFRKEEDVETRAWTFATMLNFLAVY